MNFVVCNNRKNSWQVRRLDAEHPPCRSWCFYCPAAREFCWRLHFDWHIQAMRDDAGFVGTGTRCVDKNSIALNFDRMGFVLNSNQNLEITSSLAYSSWAALSPGNGARPCGWCDNSATPIFTSAHHQTSPSAPVPCALRLESRSKLLQGVCCECQQHQF